MRYVARVLCLLSLAGCGSRTEGSPLSHGPTPFMGFRITEGLGCAADAGLSGCLRQHEPVSDSGPDNEPGRIGSRLCLPLRSSRACFSDVDGLRYTLLGRERGRFIVVETQATGGYAVILVDEANGARRRVDNRPLVNRDGRLFATVSYDVDADYVPNRVVVWASSRETPLYEVGGFAAGAGPVAIRWTGAARLEVRYRQGPDSAGEASVATFSIWQDGEGRWHDDYRR